MARLASAAVLLVALAGAASARSDAPAPGPGTLPDRTTRDFCARAQQLAAGTSLVPDTVVHADFDAYRKSKPAIQPLRTEQYVLRDGRGAPLRISCKLKTPDHIRAVHGADAAAAEPLQCAELNRAIVRGVFAGLDADERARVRIPAHRIMLDPDEVTVLGSTYVQDYDYVYAAADGRLHLFARSLRVDWTNRMYAWAPDSVRGTHYCHLIAPEHLRRLVLGEAGAPPRG